jgi:hypothetical protein
LVAGNVGNGGGVPTRYAKTERHTLNAARLVRQRKEDNGRICFLSMEEELALRTAIRNDYHSLEPELDLALHTGLHFEASNSG